MRKKIANNSLTINHLKVTNIDVKNQQIEAEVGNIFKQKNKREYDTLKGWNLLSQPFFDNEYGWSPMKTPFIKRED